VPSQAGPRNDIHAGSPRLQKAQFVKPCASSLVTIAAAAAKDSLGLAILPKRSIARRICHILGPQVVLKNPLSFNDDIS
jgi:hypothetical protein